MENFEEYYRSAHDLLKAQGQDDIARMVSSPYVHAVFNSGEAWNDIDAYSVYVYVTPVVYAMLEQGNRIQKYEDSILNALHAVTKGEQGFFFHDVSIVARSKTSAIDGSNEKTVDASMWKTGYYRMFISHKVENKISASNLKSCMEVYGISGFVAHEDIKPSKEWQQEIENALKTAHALCAIITPKFITSTWCDQEVGFALGRGLLCIPIKKEADPYGLLGKYQAIQSKDKDSKAVAKDIFDILCMNQEATYLNCLAELLLNSKTQDDAEHWIDLIASIENLPADVAASINNRYKDNANLFKKKVLQKANALFGKYNLPQRSNPTSDNQIGIDDLPF